MSTGEALRTELVMARRFADGNERRRIDKTLAYIERVERVERAFSDDRLFEEFDRRPELVFSWLEGKGFGFNGGQQKKIRGIVGK